MDTELVSDAEPLRTEGLEVRERALRVAVKISTLAEYQAAAAELLQIASFRKRIEERLAPVKKKAFEAHRAITQLEKDLLSAPNEAEAILRQAISAYRMEEERQRRQEQARLEAEARRQAEEAALAEALELEASGDHQAAEAVVAAPILAPIVELQKPIAPGVSTRRKFRFRIKNPGAIKPAYLKPDESKIQKIVDALGLDAIAAVGGIEVFEDSIVSVRTAR